MRSLLRKSFTAPFAAFALLVVAGCSSAAETADTADTETGAADSNAAEEVRDQIVIDLLFDGQEGAVDPHRGAAPSDRTMYRGIYDTLVTFPTEDLNEPQPWLATEWSSNEDATQWTFKLREDVVFSTGNAMTAEDVVWSLNRLKNVGDRVSYLMDGTTVTATDDFTVVVETEEPNVAIPFILTSSNAAVMDSKVLAENGGVSDDTASSTDDAGQFLTSNSIGSGAYKMERFIPGSELVLVRNDTWWGSEPTYRQIVLRNADPAVQRLNILSGEADVVLDLGQEEILALGDDADLQVATSNGTNNWVVVFNLDPTVSAVTSNADFRRAAQLAIDWESLAEVGGPGAARHCGQILPSVTGALQEGDEGCIQQDLEEARALIAGAGLEGAKVTFTLQDFDRDGVSAVELGSRLSEMWKQIGIESEIVEQPDAVVADLRNSGEIEVFIVPNSMKSPHPFLYVGTMSPSGGTSQSGDNYRGGWQSSSQAGARHAPLPGQDEIEELGEKAQAAVTEEEALPLYEEWQRELNAVGPFIPLINGTASVVAKSDLPAISGYHALWGIDIPTFSGAIR